VEDETQPLEHKKITLSIIHPLPDKSVVTSEYVNKIMSDVFIIKPTMKKLRTGVSPNKPLSPRPIASVIPRTRSVIKASPIIHIQDDLEPNTFPSTIITEHPPSPQPQSPTP
jgi:hypothetical protein